MEPGFSHFAILLLQSASSFIEPALLPARTTLNDGPAVALPVVNWEDFTTEGSNGSWRFELSAAFCGKLIKNNVRQAIFLNMAKPRFLNYRRIHAFFRRSH